MDRSATSRLTAQMVKLELLAASPDPDDGRGIVFKLTAKGESRVARASMRKALVFNERLADWSAADLTAFTAFLHRFNDHRDSPVE